MVVRLYLFASLPLALPGGGVRWHPGSLSWLLLHDPLGGDGGAGQHYSQGKGSWVVIRIGKAIQ